MGIVRYMFCMLLSAVLASAVSAQPMRGSMLTGIVNEEQFGRNVKLSADGSILAVGAPFNSKYGDRVGRVAVYKFDGSNWQMMGNEIWPGKKDFSFGEMMELSADGKKLIVATPFGGVSFYDFDGKDWIKAPQVIQLENNNDQIDALAITPDAKKIAFSFDCAKHRTLCINAFYFDGQQWLQDGGDIIPSPDEHIYSLALSFSADGQTLVVGNKSKDSKQHKNAGEVLIYSKEADKWVEQSTKFSGDLPNGKLGGQVLLSTASNTIVASSSSMDILEQNAGFVETYTQSVKEWMRNVPTIKPTRSNSYFAYAISLSADGTVLALSAPYIGFGKPGYVKVFKIKASGWQEIVMITDKAGVEISTPANNTVGWSIALSSDSKTLAIGFPHNDENGDMSGKVVVYDLSRHVYHQ